MPIACFFPSTPYPVIYINANRRKGNGLTASAEPNADPKPECLNRANGLNALNNVVIAAPIDAAENVPNIIMPINAAIMARPACTA